MDAISFVIGVKTKSLRSDSLDQLIYDTSKREEEGVLKSPAKKLGKASVTLVMRKKGTDEELFFTRTIESTDKTLKSNYLFNKKKIKFNEYEEKLKELNLFVRAQNFLVFQGTIDSLVAGENTMEITNMIEEISGSIEYKREYDKVIQKKKIFFFLKFFSKI